MTKQQTVKRWGSERLLDVGGSTKHFVVCQDLDGWLFIHSASGLTGCCGIATKRDALRLARWLETWPISWDFVKRPSWSDWTKKLAQRIPASIRKRKGKVPTTKQLNSMLKQCVPKTSRKAKAT